MESAIRSGRMVEILKNSSIRTLIQNSQRAKRNTYDYTVDIFWSFLEKFEGDQDSLNHLRGACDRLLTENPDNAALMLFRAFSRLLIINYNKNDALSDMRKGWDIFIEKEGWTRNSLLLNFKDFITLLVRSILLH